jgi:hypothetical protein
LTAFPVLMWWLSKIVVSLILITSFMTLIYAWVLMTTWWYDQSNYSKGIELIEKVIRWIALLWASGVILHLINPNFFN